MQFGYYAKPSYFTEEDLLSRLYHKLTNPWLALIFGALAGFLFSHLANGLATLPPDAPSIFALQLAFTPQRFQFVLD